MGETDRLLTILTVEHGLIRVIVPGARKHKSRLGGRSSQFVVNELLIVQGKQLDKLVQAETVRSFPGLATDLGRLTASQYLAELVLCQALSGQPQSDLFALLVEYLQRLEQGRGEAVLACLSQGIFQLLVLAGVAPEVGQCSVSQVEIVPDFRLPDWRVGFSAMSGGIVSLEQIGTDALRSPRAGAPRGRYAIDSRRMSKSGHRSPATAKTTLITASELALLQKLGQPEPIMEQAMPGAIAAGSDMRGLWRRIEQLLRQYAQYHFDRPIRSATLIDECFSIAVASE